MPCLCNVVSLLFIDIAGVLLRAYLYFLLLSLWEFDIDSLNCLTCWEGSRRPTQAGYVLNTIDLLRVWL